MRFGAGCRRRGCRCRCRRIGAGGGRAGICCGGCCRFGIATCSEGGGGNHECDESLVHITIILW